MFNNDVADRFMQYLFGSLVVPYIILLAHILYNIIQYVCRQQKYKEFHIAVFYVIAVATVSIRVFAFSYQTFHYSYL